MTRFPSRSRLTSDLHRAERTRSARSPCLPQAVVVMQPIAAPAHPPKSVEKLDQERGTWFDMYPGRAATEILDISAVSWGGQPGPLGQTAHNGRTQVVFFHSARAA